MSIIENDIMETAGQKSEHGETLEHLSGDNNFSKKSFLYSPEQAYAFATLWSIADENDIQFIKSWLKNIADWNISIEARGRTDIVEVSRYKSGGSLPFAEKLLEKFDKH